jgi:tRNA G26 N,N-dimethylase Trm1
MINRTLGLEKKLITGRMIEVFKTNVQSKKQAKELTAMLKKHFGFKHVTFDLHDCDKILRIESTQVTIDCVVGLLRTRNVDCHVLAD